MEFQDFDCEVIALTFLLVLKIYFHINTYLKTAFLSKSDVY